MAKMVLLLLSALAFVCVAHPDPMRMSEFENEGHEDPSAAEAQHVLRRMFRSSGEQDQTAFHPEEEETENQNIQPAAETPGYFVPFPVGHNEKSRVLRLTFIDGQDTPIFRELNTTEFLDSAEQNQGFYIGPNEAIYMISGEEVTSPNHESDHEHDEMLEEKKRAESELVGTSSEGLRVSEVAEEAIDVNTAVALGDGPVENSADVVHQSPPKSMLPPPFLVTKPFHGANYIYQLRYPTPRYHHEHPIVFTDKDFSDDDKFLHGLNKTNVFGPPLPVDLAKLRDQTAKAIETIPALKDDSVKLDGPPPANIFMFFKSRPYNK